MGTSSFVQTLIKIGSNAGGMEISFKSTSGGGNISSIAIEANSLSIMAAFAPSTNTWYAIKICRISGVMAISINGVSQALTDNTGPTTSISDTTGNINIGYVAGRSDASGMNGYIDEFKWDLTSDGLATYTVETLPFTLVAATGFTFDPLQVGALFKLTHYVGGPAVSVSFGSAITSSSIKCFTTWRLITHGTWTGKLRIEKSSDGGSSWTTLRSFSSADDSNFDTSGTESIDTNPVPFLVRLNMFSYTSGTCTADLTSDPFYQDGIVKATAYVSPTALTVTVINEVASTGNTTTWAEGSFSNYRGWPSVSRFFQDRLCYANTLSEPQTIWMTATGDYYSFIRHSTLLDTDGITINLPSRQVNEINGLLAFKKLIVFTASSIWSVGPLSTSALTPTSVQTEIEEYHGSSGLNPAVVGDESIYTEFGGELIRNIGYQLQVDGFTGSEANILATHLFQGFTIAKMAYQRNPNNVIWCLRSDGVLLSLTYNQEQQVVAWAHHDTNGTIESICVIPGDNGDELWASIHRTNGRYIERMIGRKQFNLTGHIFMDSYITQANSTLVVTAAHLASQVVSILADGVVLASQTVSASGTLTMSSTYTTLYVGIPYSADLETLNVEVPSRTGTIQGNKIKIGNVTFRLINTRGGYIGPNISKLYESMSYTDLNRANQLMLGTTLGTTSNFSGDIRVPLGGEYSNGGRLFYRQNDPLPVTISDIVPEVEPGGKSS